MMGKGRPEAFSDGIIGTPNAFVSRWFAGALYVCVALMWLLPDRRIERVLAETQSGQQ